MRVSSSSPPLRQPATTSVLREALGVSRKRAISILEHLDAVRFTVLDKDAGGLRSLR